MSFEKLKEGQRFMAIVEKEGGEFINLGEVITIGGYDGVKYRVDEFKKKHPGRWAKIAMVVEEVV